MKTTALCWARWAALAMLPLATFAHGANVGQWNGGGRTWNDPSFSQTLAAVTGAGNTVEVAGAITAGNLSNDNLFIIFEPTTAPTAGELSALAAYVSGGGTLVVFGESSADATVMNQIVAGAGGTITWSGSASGASTVLASPFSSSPNNILGQSVTTSLGILVSGGTAFLSNGYGAYQQVGAGRIVAYADRLDFNFGSAVNTNLMVNMVAGGGAPPPPPPSASVPVPGVSGAAPLAALALLLSLVAGVYLRRRSAIRR